MLFNKLSKILRERIMILDGSMGAFIQNQELTEEDFRGTKFRDHQNQLKGNNDILSITKPGIIKKIHADYLDAGADIIETNTFNATSISQAEYSTANFVYEMNFRSAAIAKEAVLEFSKKNSSTPKFVAGALGPTSKTLSMSTKVEDPGFRELTFVEMMNSYYEQVRGLVDGGADILLIETITDTLNAKSALFAIHKYFDEKGIILPIMISGTIIDQSGRTLSGQTSQQPSISANRRR